MSLAPSIAAADPAKAQPFLGWRIVIIAFLAQNCAIGMNFGVYGTLVDAIQQHFATSRTLASSGLSVMTLVMGLMSPLVGALMQRVPVRLLMILGALGNAVGYVALTFVHSIEALLAVYALVIGPSVCLLGVIPSSALVSHWFVAGRGKALGFVNMPFFVFVCPMIAAAILQARGMDALFMTVAAVFLCLVPLLLFVVEKPADVGQQAHGAAPAGTATSAGPAPASSRAILTSVPFLVLSLSIGIVTAGGVMMVTHLVPMAVAKGLDLQAAAALLSAFGVAGALGALLFGWLADRIGGPAALSVQALAWILPWTALLFVGADFLELLVLATLMGLCSGGIVGLCGVIMNQWLGHENFGRAMGYLYFLKIPFLFGAAPLAGWIFDRSGGYGPAIVMHIASFAAVGALFLFYRPKGRAA